MKFKLGLAQCKHPEDGNALTLVERFCGEAAAAECALLCFPESLMTPYEKEKQAFLKDAEPVDGPFSQTVCELAAKHGLWVAYTINELNPEGNPFNTALIADDQGNRRFIYRKAHLFDTDFTRESDRMARGSELSAPVAAPFASIGLGICYDLRFPEVARKAALAGAELMLYPAAWVSGSRKIEQWQTLLCARAIENEMFVAGLSRADEGYIGSSCIVDPRGEIIAQASEGEELLTAEIDTELIEEVRASMPVFTHRRPELY